MNRKSVRKGMRAGAKGYKCIMLMILVGMMTQANAQHFTVIPLGVRGGSDESNLSCYALAVKDTDQYVCLDAGTVYAGVQKAIDKGLWHGEAADVVKENIKGYLISHPHFDHAAGLILNAPDDSKKSIYGLPFCIDVMKDKHFSWKSWANFADDGEKPTLNKYHYTVLDTNQETPLANTTMLVTPFALSHASPGESTAFLIRNGDAYVLYLGDTGADVIEKSDRLKTLWQTVGPLIKAGKLKAMFIEVSYSNEQPDASLFGHLTPRLLQQELEVLKAYASAESIRRFPVVITHIKHAPGREKKIRQQLSDGNTTGVTFIYAEQTVPLRF